MPFIDLHNNLIVVRYLVNSNQGQTLSILPCHGLHVKYFDSLLTYRGR